MYKMVRYCSRALDLLVCVFLCLHKGISVYSQAGILIPSFSVPAVNITAVSGRTAVLPCTIESVGTHKVAWMDPKGKLLTMGDQRAIHDTRISVERPFKTEWNLHIRQVRMNDTGEFMCQINTNPVKSMRILLIVSEPPTIIAHAKKHIIVEEGAEVRLWCKVSGEPYPSVTWYRKYIHDDHATKKVMIAEEGDGLLIRNVSRYCEDAYECEANNNIEPKATATMTVTVEFAPEVELYVTRLSQKKGKETILQCKITANPHQYSVWKFKGQELKINSIKYGINVYEEEDRYTKTLSLRIGHISDTDFGKYKCFSTNNYGTDEQAMVLAELKDQPPATLPSITRPGVHIKDTDVHYGRRNHGNGDIHPTSQDEDNIFYRTWENNNANAHVYRKGTAAVHGIAVTSHPVIAILLCCQLLAQITVHIIRR